jgi:hypothetical protein
MTFADENSVVAEFFGALSPLMDFIDVFDAAVDAMQAKAHDGSFRIKNHWKKQLGLNAQRPMPNSNQGVDLSFSPCHANNNYITSFTNFSVWV